MATDPSLRTIERRVLAVHRDVLDILERLSTMTDTVETLNAKADALASAAADAKADAERQTALVQSAVTAMGDMRAAIADLQSQLSAGTPVTQEQIDALGAKLDAALADAATANTARDAADAALQGGIPPA